MDLNTVLLLLVGIHWISFLASLVRGHVKDRDEVLLGLACFAVFAVALWAAPPWAGIVGAVPLVVTSIVPSALAAWRNRLFRADRTAGALRLSWAIRILHPTGTSRDGLAIARARHLEAQGRDHEAREAMERLAGSESLMGALSRAHALGQEGRWEELRRHIDGSPLRSQLLQDPWCVSLYLLALGNLHDLPRLVAGYRETLRTLRRASPQERHLAQLSVAAFAGDVATSARLRARLSLPEPQDALSQVTALQAAGRGDEARPILDRLAASDDPVVRAVAADRLAHPRPVASLSPDERAVVDRLAREIAYEDAHAPVARSQGRPVATLAILALIALGFLLEVPGGTTDLENLAALGAVVVPVSLMAGEWWRVLTATFLHFGAVHVVMNGLALWIFGRHLERISGPQMVLASFFLCGPGSMATAALLWRGPADVGVVMVGASGAILGCLGTTGAILLLRFLRSRHAPEGDDLRDVLSAAALQVVVGFVIPNVSAAAHAAGFALGLLLGAASELAGRRPRRP